MRESIKTESSSEEILQAVGALQNGHFLLTSGLHSDRYIQGQRLLQFPRYSTILANRLAEQIWKAGHRPNIVIGPALGAIHWEVFMANALDSRTEEPIKAMFAERTTDPNAADPNGFILRRGMELGPGDKVLVVEDVTTTGGSVVKVINLVRELGAEPIAVGAVVDRSGGTIDFGIPFFKLLTFSIQNHAEPDCPMCKQGTKAIKPGSSKK